MCPSSGGYFHQDNAPVRLFKLPGIYPASIIGIQFNVRLIATQANSNDFVSPICSESGEKKPLGFDSKKMHLKISLNPHTKDRGRMGLKIQQHNINMKITGLKYALISINIT